MTTRKTTILLADNNPEFLRLVSYHLQYEGYAVIGVSNGEQALEQTRVQQPDLVLLDLLMPKVDGFTVCQRIRKDSTVPILILTAWGAEKDRMRGLDLGADDYLNKPFDVEELLARIRAILRRSPFSAHVYSDRVRLINTIGDFTSIMPRDT